MQPEQPITTPQPESPTPVAPQLSPPTVDQGKTLGILGLIFAFIVPLVGLILSIIGQNQSKKAGVRNTPAKLGIIFGIIMMFLPAIVIMIIVYVSLPTMQRNSRDTRVNSNVAVIRAGLQEYKATNNYYPSSLHDLTGINSDALRDPVAGPYKYTPTPVGCTTTCTGYTLTAPLEGGGSDTVKSD